MPTYKDITISLRSSLSTEPLPEFPPPFSSDIPLEDGPNATVSVYVPSTPKMQFWLAYTVKPSEAIHLVSTQFFVFKLFLDGRHLVTWGIGEEEQWKGKTMFGLWANDEWKGGIEQRAFIFSEMQHQDDDNEEYDGEVEKDAGERAGILEVRVLRASARKRVAKALEEFGRTRIGNEGGGGIDIVNAGAAKGHHPKRFYKFALLDPIDKAFATFRYHHRTWEQLKALGVIQNPPTSILDRVQESNSSLSIEETIDNQPPSSATHHTMLASVGAGIKEDSLLIDGESFNSECTESIEVETASLKDRNVVKESTSFLRRLSFPPSTRLFPPEGAHDTVITTRSSSLSNIRFGRTMEQEWFRRTPSPVKEAMDETREYVSPRPDGTRRRTNPTGKLREMFGRAMGKKVVNSGGEHFVG